MDSTQIKRSLLIAIFSRAVTQKQSLCMQYLFKHKLEQINTWTSSFIPYRRRNPYRCQIDYIIASKNLRNPNFDSKALNRLSIETDHKLILSKFKIETSSRRKIYSQNLQNSRNQLNVEHLKERKEIYNEIVEKELENTNLQNEEPQEYWKKLSDILINSSKKIENKKYGEDAKQKNNDIEELNEKQRELNKEIDECNNREERQRLKKEKK